MSIIDLQNINSQCHSFGGVKKILFANRSNISLLTGFPQLIDSNQIFTFEFLRNTGQYEEKLKSTRGGDIIDQTLKFFINKKRFDVDYVISQIIDNRLTVFYEDFNGITDILLNSKLVYKYFTGDKRSSRNGYEFTLTSRTRKKYKNIIGVGVDINIGTPQEPGQSGTIVNNGSEGGNTQSPLLVIVNPNPINFIPQASGNTQFLNQFVIDPNGHKHFIDYLGTAMKFDVLPRTHIQLTSDDFVGNTVTVPGVPLDPKDYYVNLNGNQRTLSNSIAKNTFTRNGDDFTFYKLTSNSTLDFYL